MTLSKTNDPIHCLLENDPSLKPYEKTLRQRMSNIREMEKQLTGGDMSLAEFASGHEFFGLHSRDGEWVFREWAPNAVAVYLVGNMTGWREKEAFALTRINEMGAWEIRLPGSALAHGDLYRLGIHWPGDRGDRIPAYARSVVQDPESQIFNALVWKPPDPYEWTCDSGPALSNAPFIYEAHVGMAQEEEKIGSYREFTRKILPRIIDSGYNCIQLMGIQAHPYYASFGYQVSSFFAASSLFGNPEELKELIDAAHGGGLRVFMDLIHSHAAPNEVEGISLFDGTPYQYFHEGSPGHHPAWGSRCFDYGKPEVLHFLLSNCRFWLDEYRFDGFRFDGVTSMLYRHHGLDRTFSSHDDYFGESVDEDALAYLSLANQVIHDARPDAVTIAEDVSGMPCLAVPNEAGGAGFDFRFAMGVPDYWIQLVKDVPDEEWPLGHLWFELNNRRAGEKTISYSESHDQALVGDQTLIFRLIGVEMYDRMGLREANFRVDRGVALHKLIRFITLAAAGDGYLNFMGNEFGHPDWIDFPRDGNQWSFRHARRQWSLADDPDLRYGALLRFDKEIIALARRRRLLESPDASLVVDNPGDKVLAFWRAGLLFVFNFHHERSHVDFPLEAAPGTYRMVLDSDARRYGGHGRLAPDQRHFTAPDVGSDREAHFLSLYLPTRTALVLEKEGRQWLNR